MLAYLPFTFALAPADVTALIIIVLLANVPGMGAVDNGGQANQQHEGEKSEFHFRETVGDFKFITSKNNKKGQRLLGRS